MDLSESKEMNSENNNAKENNTLKPVEKIQLIEKIACQLQQQMSTSDINIFLFEYDIKFIPENVASSKRIYVKEILSKVESKVVLRIAEDIGLMEKSNLVEVEELKKIDSSYINEQIVKCNSKINSGDYDGAITNARTLIESVCIFILDESGTDYNNEGNLIKLYKLVSNTLNMNPQTHENDSLKQICSGFFSIINGLATMRNSLSDAHGKGITNRYKPERRHAVVAVNSSKTISEYLLSSWRA